MLKLGYANAGNSINLLLRHEYDLTTCTPLKGCVLPGQPMQGSTIFDQTVYKLTLLFEILGGRKILSLVSIRWVCWYVKQARVS